jgi:hypothetical protein
MFDERHRYSRIPLTIPIQCFVGARELPECKVRNLSSTGMLLAGDGTIHPREKVRLLFRLEENSPIIPARAQVVWVADDQLAGVRFLAIGTDDRKRIRTRIAAEIDNLPAKWN